MEDKFTEMIREMELMSVASDRDFAKRQIAHARRTLIFNRWLMAFYSLIGVWYLLMTVFNEWWYIFFALLWFGLASAYLWMNRRMKQLRADAEQRIDIARRRIEALERGELP